jgi:hypothetical protein
VWYQEREVARIYEKSDQVVLWYKGRVCVPNTKELKDKIFWDAHETAYSIHLGRNKVYHDLKATYWRYWIKRDVAEYVALCDTCQRVKTEHQRPARRLQLLQGPEWKWKEIAMDFVRGLLRTQSGYDDHCANLLLGFLHYVGSKNLPFSSLITK